MARKGKGGGGGGGGEGGSRVYIASARAEKGSKAATIDLTVELRQTRESPAYTVPTRVLFQDKPLGVMQVRDPVTHTFSEIKLDESKTPVLRIEKAGFTGQGESLEVDLKPAKAPKAPAHKKRFEVVVGWPQADHSNPVHFVTRDEDFHGIKGTVRIDAGQRFWINGVEVQSNELYNHPTDDQGTDSVSIELEKTGLVTFIHVESGEHYERMLKGRTE